MPHRLEAHNRCCSVAVQIWIAGFSGSSLGGVSLRAVLTIAKNSGSILAIVGRSEPFWVSRERPGVGGSPDFRLGKWLLPPLC